MVLISHGQLALQFRLTLARSQNVFVFNFLSVLYSLFSYLFGTITFRYCRLLYCHCLTITKLINIYTVFVVVLTDFEKPPENPFPAEEEKLSSNIEKPLPNPPKPPKPPKEFARLVVPEPPFRLLKKPEKKSSS